MADTTQFWDYLEGVETPEQYNCFASYRDMGPQRSIRAVSQLHSEPAGKLYAWADRCSWDERARDFDIEQARIRDALLTARRTQINTAWAERRALILEQLEESVTLGYERLLYNQRTGRSQLRPNELRLMVETLAKWQNLANGDATEKVDIGVDYSNLTDEQLNQLEAIEQSQAKRASENVTGRSQSA